jgi:hypothetical protein
MYYCCNIYTHPKKKDRKFFYKNHQMNLQTDMRMRSEGYELTMRVIIGQPPK